MKQQIIKDENDTMFVVTIGKTAQENWDIIGMSRPEDLWFHVENNPSCHVILKLCDHGEIGVSKKVIGECAQLCKENSKFKNHRKIAIVYSKVKDIRKGDQVGEVITKGSKTYRIVI